jgi:hypothetical protein
MRKPEPITPDVAESEAGRKPTALVLESDPDTVVPHAIPPFIRPPTREQLMAGSTNVRRVYKVEP